MAGLFPCAVALVLCTAAGILSAQNLQKIYPPGSEAVRLLETLQLHQGRARPFASAPYSEAEILAELARVDEDALPTAGRLACRRLREILRKRPLLEIPGPSAGEGISFALRPEINFESYVQIREGEEDWEYRFEERRPLMSLPFEIWAAEHIYAMLDISVRKIAAVFPGEDTAEPVPFSNFPHDIRTIDGNFPFRAFIAFGGDIWGLQFGRDRLSWGNGRTGNLVLGDNPLFYNFARFSLYGNVFKFSTVWANMESHTWTEDGRERQVERNFIGHRLEVRLGDSVNLGLTEAVVLAKPVMEMKYLNPVMIYHGWYLDEGELNIIASIDAEAAILPGLSVYAQAAVNQFTLPMEAGKEYAKGEPDAYGFIAGVEGVRSLGDGFLSAGIEGALTSPWLYIHRTYRTQFFYTQMIMAENTGHRVTVEKPLGYPTGPDTLSLSAAAAYTVPLRYRLSGDMLLRWRGRNSFADISDTFIPAADPDPVPGSRDWTTPAGAYPEFKTVVRLGGEYWPSWRGYNTDPAGRGTSAPILGERGRELSLGTDLYLIRTANRGAEKSPVGYNLQAVLWVTVKW
jgi:hypothetical protein